MKEKLENTMIDIDELAKKIEERLKELNNEKQEAHEKKKIKADAKKTVDDFCNLLDDIEGKVKRLVEHEVIDKLNIEDVTKKINKKLDKVVNENEELEKTIYNLNEISMVVSETIKKLEKEKKKRERKAKYCKLAREKERKIKKIKKEIAKKKINKKK